MLLLNARKEFHKLLALKWESTSLKELQVPFTFPPVLSSHHACNPLSVVWAFLVSDNCMNQEITTCINISAKNYYAFFLVKWEIWTQFLGGYTKWQVIYKCNKVFFISQEKVYVDYLEITLYFISNFTVYINF